MHSYTYRMYVHVLVLSRGCLLFCFYLFLCIKACVFECSKYSNSRQILQVQLHALINICFMRTYLHVYIQSYMICRVYLSVFTLAFL